MGLKERLKSKALQSASKKLLGGTPKLKQLAIDNDACYNGLMEMIQSINDGRRAKRKYVTKTH